MTENLKKFAAATNNELFDADYKGGEWMVEAVETQETLEQWEESSNGWNERTAMKTAINAVTPRISQSCQMASSPLPRVMTSRRASTADVTSRSPSLPRRTRRSRSHPRRKGDGDRRCAGSGPVEEHRLVRQARSARAG